MILSGFGQSAIVPFGDGLSFYCPAEQRGMARIAYIFQDRFEPELSLLGQFVKPGDSVVDIGANYGAYTLKLAQLVGPKGSVLAVEPASHAVDVLSRNLTLNGITNVRVESVAIGEAARDGSLYLDANSARNRLVPIAEGAVGVERIRIVPLDDLVSGPVSFVKIDVEGAEPFVFRGASGVLSKYRPVVQFEYTPGVAREMGADPHELWEQLERLDYRMHELVDGQLRVVERAPEDGLINLIAVPQH